MLTMSNNYVGTLIVTPSHPGLTRTGQPWPRAPWRKIARRGQMTGTVLLTNWAAFGLRDFACF